MSYYQLLSFATVLITALALLLWIKTRNVSIPIGIALMYYMSLYGAWAVIVDKSGGDSGMHYSYIEEKLFNVNLDYYYWQALLLYTVFIVTVEVVLLIVLRYRRSEGPQPRDPVRISHAVILSVSGVACIATYLLVRDGIQTASVLNVSPYDYMRRGFGETPAYFTIHQLLNRIALLPSVIGLVTMLSGSRPQLVAGRGRKSLGVLYVLPIGFMVWLSFLLGYKSELFVAGVTGGLFYLANARRPRVLASTMLGLIVVAGMALVDLARFIPASEVGERLSGLNASDAAQVFKFVQTSNEAFAAHFSMYGALAYDIPLTYGSSLLALAASVVPRFLWPARPGDIYGYYAESVNAVAGQGYTIHHATGWYLNFGIGGVFLGALLLGAVWAACFNGYAASRRGDSRTRWSRLFCAIAPWSLVGYLPFLLRTGPEVYKGLLVEAFLIPVGVLGLASYCWHVFPAGGRGARLRSVDGGH